jgi:hypothetical protein
MIFKIFFTVILLFIIPCFIIFHVALCKNKAYQSFSFFNNIINICIIFSAVIFLFLIWS